jgi:methionyl-tRNA formyltransferase
MDEKIDHGPIISQKRIALILQENSQTLEKKLAQTTADFLIETLPQYLQGKIKPHVQDESKATYTKILTRQDGQIDWQKSAQEIARKVRAFYPWPGAWTEFNGQRVKILKAKAVDKQQKETISTGKGFLSLEIVQPAGKKPMTGQEFFRGHKKTFSNN